MEGNMDGMTTNRPDTGRPSGEPDLFADLPEDASDRMAEYLNRELVRGILLDRLLDQIKPTGLRL